MKFSYDRLPKSGVYGYIIEDDSKSFLDEIIDDSSVPKNKSKFSCSIQSFILPCEHLVLLIFLMKLQKPPAAGEIFRVLPPW